MSSNLQINRSLARKLAMDHSGKTVSEAAMLSEWQEVQAAQKDPAAFRVLYERYHEPVFRFVFRRTSDESLTADLCSQVFLKALQQINRYVYKGVPFSAWLFRIASNEVGQYYRSSAKNRVVSLESTSLKDLMDEMDGPDLSGLQDQMVRALDGLKESDLILIELRFFEKRPYKEISAIMNISVTNAKVKVHRILERLKRKLNG